jgi:hypothetical protein
MLRKATADVLAISPSPNNPIAAKIALVRSYHSETRCARKRQGATVRQARTRCFQTADYECRHRLTISAKTSGIRYESEVEEWACYRKNKFGVVAEILDNGAPLQRPITSIFIDGKRFDVERVCLARGYTPQRSADSRAGYKDAAILSEQTELLRTTQKRARKQQQQQQQQQQQTAEIDGQNPNAVAFSLYFKTATRFNHFVNDQKNPDRSQRKV